MSDSILISNLSPSSKEKEIKNFIYRFSQGEVPFKIEFINENVSKKDAILTFESIQCAKQVYQVLPRYFQGSTIQINLIDGEKAESPVLDYGPYIHEKERLFYKWNSRISIVFFC